MINNRPRIKTTHYNSYCLTDYLKSEPARNARPKPNKATPGRNIVNETPKGFDKIGGAKGKITENLKNIVEKFVINR